MVKFWSQVYKQWNLTNKIMFWLAVIGIIVGILFGGKHIININSNNDIMNVENSTFKNSPIFQRSSNISLTYNPAPDDDLVSPFYSTKLFMEGDKLIFDGKKYNFYFMKIILPDDQEAFIPELLFNKSYDIANCNEQWTDCYVYHKFRIKGELKEDDICWIFTTRFGHDYLHTDALRGAKRFQNNPANCSKLIQD